MSLLRHIAATIQAIAPGHRINIDREMLRDATPPMPLVGFGGPVWTPAERVMENIGGSAYEFRFWESADRRTIVFERLKQPLSDGRRTFVSPDRRDRFEQDDDGFYRPLSEPHARG